VICEVAGFPQTLQVAMMFSVGWAGVDMEADAAFHECRRAPRAI
jgi:hypothetical protein